MFYLTVVYLFFPLVPIRVFKGIDFLSLGIPIFVEAVFPSVANIPIKGDLVYGFIEVFEKITGTGEDTPVLPILIHFMVYRKTGNLLNFLEMKLVLVVINEVIKKVIRFILIEVSGNILFRSKKREE